MGGPFDCQNATNVAWPANLPANAADVPIAADGAANAANVPISTAAVPATAVPAAPWQSQSIQSTDFGLGFGGVDSHPEAGARRTTARQDHQPPSAAEGRGDAVDSISRGRDGGAAYRPPVRSRSDLLGGARHALRGPSAAARRDRAEPRRPSEPRRARPRRASRAGPRRAEPRPWTHPRARPWTQP